MARNIKHGGGTHALNALPYGAHLTTLTSDTEHRRGEHLIKIPDFSWDNYVLMKEFDIFLHTNKTALYRDTLYMVNSGTGLFIIATDLAVKTNSSTERISRFFDKR